MRRAHGQGGGRAEGPVVSPISAAVRAVAVHGLPEVPPPPPSEVADGDLARFRADIVAGRLTGLAVLAHEAGALRLSAAGAADLSADDAAWAANTLRAEDVMLESVGRLAAAGIPSRVLKGSALAERTWTMGQARRWVDADLLVPASDIGDAVRVLTEAGATRRVPELRPGFDRRFAKSVTLRSTAGPEIDLHRTLVLGPHTFLVPHEDLWSSSQPFRVDGQELETLGPTATFVHLCMHATITGDERLVTVRDVVESGRAIDLAETAAMAARWRATRAVQLALGAATERLGLGDDHPLARWAAGLDVPPRDERLFAVYEAGQRTPRRLAVATLRHVPRRLDQLRFARAFVWPAPRSRRAWGRSASRQLRHVTRRRR